MIRQSRHPVRPERCPLLVLDRFSRPYHFYRQCRNYPVNERTLSCERHGVGPHYLYAPADDGDVSDSDVRDHLTPEAAARLQARLSKADEMAELLGANAERNRLARERDEQAALAARLTSERDEQAALAARLTSEREEQAALAARLAGERDELVARGRRATQERDRALAALEQARGSDVARERDELAGRVAELERQLAARMEAERGRLAAMQAEVDGLNLEKQRVDDLLVQERRNHAACVSRLEAARQTAGNFREQERLYSDLDLEKRQVERRLRQLAEAQEALEAERDGLREELGQCQSSVVEALESAEEAGAELQKARRLADFNGKQLEACHAERDEQGENLQLSAAIGQQLVEELEACREKLDEGQ